MHLDIADGSDPVPWELNISGNKWALSYIWFVFCQEYSVVCILYFYIPQNPYIAMWDRKWYPSKAHKNDIVYKAGDFNIPAR